MAGAWEQGAEMARSQEVATKAISDKQEGHRDHRPTPSFSDDVGFLLTGATPVHRDQELYDRVYGDPDFEPDRRK